MDGAQDAHMTTQIDTRSQILLDRIDHLPRWPFLNYVPPIVGFAYFFAFYRAALLLWLYLTYLPLFYLASALKQRDVNYSHN